MSKLLNHVLLVAAVAASVGCGTRGIADTPFEEITLSDRVEAQLRAEEALADAQIDAQTNDGVVMLVGEVTSVEDALLAERIAQATPGVIQVLNEIELGDGDYDAPIPDEPVSQQEDSAESMMDPSW